MSKDLREIPDYSIQSFGKFFLFLSLVSLTINLGVHYRAQPVDFTCEAGRISLALLRGQGFANPFKTAVTGPTAHVAPLYPYLHSLVCRLFGVQALGSFAIITLTSLAWSLQWTFVHRFAVDHGRARSGAAAALIGVLVPLPGRLFKWDTVFTALALTACAWMVSAVIRRQWNGRRHGLMIGAVAAWGSLLNPATLQVWAAWTAFIMLKIGVQKSRKVLLPALAVFLAPIVIWGVRNYVVMGYAGFVRDNVGLEMSVSYNDCAKVLLAENMSSGCYTGFHPNVNVDLATELARVGEYKFNSAAGRKAKEWAFGHPWRAFKLTIGHIAAYWFPIETDDPRTLLIGLLMSASTLGAILSVRWRWNDGFYLLVLGVVAYSCVYCWVQFEQRYRYPVLWCTLLLACIGVELLLARRHTAATRSASSTQG
jgi:hypothetical protein